MESNKILAIVVTYNRKELLKENLDALIHQTKNDFDILVIDNASSDGTDILVKEYKEKYNNIYFHGLAQNVGGAGGFYKGMQIAYEKNYDYAWIMDDDTIPNATALEELWNVKNNLNNEFSFLNSLVLWTDGTLAHMNVPAVKEFFVYDYQNIEKGLIPIESCSFVSCFVNLNKVKSYGLPISEFFIYFDDMEYTKRISDAGNSYLVLSSKVVHKMKTNTGTTAERICEKEKVKRLFYDYRNGFYLAKKKGFKKTVRYIGKYFYHVFKILFTKNQFKFEKIKYMTKGFVHGIFFNPKIEYIK
ncbi:MAG: glycosyltransferase family 2 protein [Clostridia bacterium]|nr:glycosyltransferase family 2 protein [Clostridia bacterium]